MNGCCADNSCDKSTCMGLPDGATCGNCAHWKSCNGLGFSSDERRTDCDFFPRRYRVAKPTRPTFRTPGMGPNDLLPGTAKPPSEEG